MDKYVKHYNDHYKREGESGSGQLIWKPQYEIWVRAGYKPDMSVLDYGCGVGIMIEAGIKRELYIGLDISEVAVELASKRYPGYDFFDFEMGKLSTAGCDMAVAQSVFTHTPKSYVDKCLKDIKRNFKDFAIIDVLHGHDNPLDEHVRRFTVDEWQDYLWKAGLYGERIGSHDFVGFDHIYYKITHSDNS